MFTSTLNHKDLMFQDATVRLVHVPPEKQDYEEYLGPRFLRAMERMEGIDDITSAAPHATLLPRLVDLFIASVLAVLVASRVWLCDPLCMYSRYNVVELSY